MAQHRPAPQCIVHGRRLSSLLFFVGVNVPTHHLEMILLLSLICIPACPRKLVPAISHVYLRRFAPKDEQKRRSCASFGEHFSRDLHVISTTTVTAVQSAEIKYHLPTAVFCAYVTHAGRYPGSRLPAVSYRSSQLPSVSYRRCSIPCVSPHASTDFTIRVDAFTKYLKAERRCLKFRLRQVNHCTVFAHTKARCGS